MYWSVCFWTAVYLAVGVAASPEFASIEYAGIAAPSSPAAISSLPTCRPPCYGFYTLSLKGYSSSCLSYSSSGRATKYGTDVTWNACKSVEGDMESWMQVWLLYADPAKNTSMRKIRLAGFSAMAVHSEAHYGILRGCMLIENAPQHKV